MGAPWRGVKANEIEEVTVVGVPAFRARPERWCPSEEPAPDRPRVRAGEPPGRGVGMAAYHRGRFPLAQAMPFTSLAVRWFVASSLHASTALWKFRFLA